jgi:hypothetical protein
MFCIIEGGFSNINLVMGEGRYMVGRGRDGRGEVAGRIGDNSSRILGFRIRLNIKVQYSTVLYSIVQRIHI